MRFHRAPGLAAVPPRPRPVSRHQSRRPDRAPTPMTPEEALSWALNEGGAHRVMSSTSRIDHLEANIWAVGNHGPGGLITGRSGLSSGG